MELYAHIVANLDMPIKRIGFYNYGEPLLHPHFGTMCRAMRERFPASYLYTSSNGTRLSDPRVRDSLLASGLDDIVLSIDGATQESYEAYRKRGDLRSILEGIQLLRRDRDRAGLARPRLLWRYLLFSWNDSDEELRTAERLAKDVGVDYFGYGFSDIPDLASRTRLPGTAALADIQSRWFVQTPPVPSNGPLD